MPIPPFKASGVVEPWWDWQQLVPGGAHGGSGEFTPHPSTMLEFVERFGTSTYRRKILDGLLRYRAALRQNSLGRECHQWLAGSFVEKLSREPNDVDVLTLRYPTTPPPATPTAVQQQQLLRLVDAKYTKATFLCDAYLVDVAAHSNSVRLLTYWTGLFSHRRVTGEWKGLVLVSLDAQLGQDAAARQLLHSLGGFS